MADKSAAGASLRRDLGTLESYAALIGILVGAGIFKVTSAATAATGPSVILGHLLLAPAVLASSVAYLVFLSTPLGLEPGGEVLHISRTFGNLRLTFLCGWLKLISYLGAAAYLADAMAVNLLELFLARTKHSASLQMAVALAALLFFSLVHVSGVRWFGRLQVAMCVVLGISLVVLIVPGLFALRLANYRPFFTGGLSGFGASLPPLFFAYAGFESLSQAAGEVRDSRARLPRVFVRGIVLTSLVFIAMTVVAFGVLPAERLGASEVPMSEAAARYLPFGAAAVVTLGAVMAIATSLNATMMVPARLALSMARDGRIPPVFGRVHAGLGTPVPGLLVSFAVASALLVSGCLVLALGIAVVALVALYALHSLALLLLPRWNPRLYAEVTARIPRRLQLWAGSCSLLTMGGIVCLQFGQDLGRMFATSLPARLAGTGLTSLELFVIWVLAGLAVYSGARRASEAGR
jgi:amino acid transporter